MRLALVRLDGVDTAKVSFRKQRAWAVYEPEKVTVQQMIAADRQAIAITRNYPDIDVLVWAVSVGNARDEYAV